MRKIIISIFIILSLFVGYNISNAYVVGSPSAKLPPAYEAYAPDSGAADQGITDTTSITVKNLVDEIGTSKKATLIFAHTGAADTTTYTLTTSDTITSNIKVWMEPGAILDGAGTLTINGPFEADLSQHFGSSITVVFGSGAVKEAYPEWWETNTTPGTTDMASAIQSAINATVKTQLLGNTYAVGTGIAIATRGRQLCGVNRYSTVIKRLAAIAAGTPTITVSQHNVVIRDLHVDNNNDAGDGIKWTAGNNGGLYGVWIQNVVTPSIAIVLSGASSNLIEDVVAYNVYRALHITAVSNAVTVRKFDCSTTATAGAAPAIQIDGASTSVRFYDGIIEHKSSAMLVSGGHAVQLYGVYVENVGNTAGVPDFELGSTTSVGFSWIGGYINQAIAPTGVHIRVNDGAKGVLIKGVYMYRNAAANAGNDFIHLNPVAGEDGDWSIEDIEMNATIAFSSINASVGAGNGARRIFIKNVRTTGAGTGTMSLTGQEVMVLGTNQDVTIADTALEVLLQGVSGTITDTGKVATIIGGYYASAYRTLASAAELTLGNGNTFNISGTTNITSIAAASSVRGREISLVFAGILTFTDGSNLKLAGNFVTTADDTIKLVCDGTNWFEDSRSIN